jgi:predicted DNA-binding transcriptional regulator AlpA
MRILSPKQTWAKTSVSPRQQGRLIERGQFPKPIPLYEGGRRIGFVEEEIDEWMAARVAAARGNGHAKRTDPPAEHRPPHRAQPPPRRPQRRTAQKTPI